MRSRKPLIKPDTDGALIAAERPSADGRSAAIKAPSVSGFINGFLDRILDFAFGLLRIALEFLSFAFGPQPVVVSGFTDGLFYIANRFIRGTFDFIARATHDVFSR
jgi:hypothetical protein